jgi:integrase/recombinase XerD
VQFLRKEDLKLILNPHCNIKHIMVLSLISSCGLRCSKLLVLKPTPFDSSRKIILLKKTNGNKDRIVSISPNILEMLRANYIVHKPTTYLFESQTKCQSYDARSLQFVLKQVLKKSKIAKPITLYWLKYN